MHSRRIINIESCFPAIVSPVAASLYIIPRFLHGNELLISFTQKFSFAKYWQAFILILCYILYRLYLTFPFFSQIKALNRLLHKKCWKNQAFTEKHFGIYSEINKMAQRKTYGLDVDFSQSFFGSKRTNISGVFNS